MRPHIALLPWGDTIEDFLEPLGLAVADFRDAVTGGWLFGYVEALQHAQVDSTVVCFSRETRSLERWRHRPTGAEMLILPVPRVALRLRASLAEPLAWSAAAAARRGPLGVLAAQPAYQLAPYLATPLRSLLREARRSRWRALVCQEYEYQRSDVCVALARMLGIPAVATFQGGITPRTRLERAVRPLAMRRWTRLIVASPAEAARVQRTYSVAATRIADVPNPLAVARWRSARREDVRAELGISPLATVVAWHGRVDMRRKGLDLLLAAWGSLPEVHDQANRRLLLVGTGPDAPELRAQLTDPVFGNVVWIDRYLLDKARLADLLSAADVYAFPSRLEGFAVAPLEAMAAGLPVVAAAAPGVRELLPHGRKSGGVVVAVDDAPALAAAIAELLNEPDERLRLGARARRRAEDAFSVDAIGRRLRRVILQEP